MGYNTTFQGELRFTREATAPQLAALSAMFGEDCREHPEWGATSAGYIDLALSPDFGGIRWDDDCEKTYGLDEAVNVVLREMRKTWPEFGLSGSLLAQGEDIKDRWALTIGDDGLAHKMPVQFTGRVVRCPHCSEDFVLESAGDSNA